MNSAGKISNMMSTAIGFMLVFISLTACTAHYPRSKPIASTQALNDFSIKGKERSDKSEELLLLLTFSGGGTRAAAFSYGVLEALAATTISIHGKERRLLDEVDVISSVSGGSFTAAYYGLFGNRIFEDYESKFLKKDVQTGLVYRILSPLNWPRLWSLHYDRSDLAADYYDELLFEKKTFEGFNRPGSPLIGINATDAALGSQFTFTASQFAPICTDLASFPVSRAVTASSAVPGAFSSVIIENHSGTCEYQMPEWAVKALRRKTTSTRQYHYAKNLKAYLDVKNYPYIHLFDGGISDNLGIRTIINATLPSGDVWKTLREVDLDKTETLAIIVVNSRNEHDISFARKDYSIPFIDTIGVASKIPLDHYSFETMEILRENLARWQRSIKAGRCKEAKSSTDDAGRNGSVKRNDCEAKLYLIEVSFDAIVDQAERKYLKDLPTSFRLEPEDVDHLRKAAWQIINESEEFQKFVEGLK